MSGQRYVWLPHESLAWSPSLLLSNDGSYSSYRLHTGEELKVQNNRIDPAALEPVSAASREGQTSNLVELDEMSEGAVIHALRSRYERDAIYTNIGPILVSINPYKLLPIYSAASIALYPPAAAAAASASAPPPHVFQVAAAAYHQLMTAHEDQAIIISGESGAGKTEATKTVLSYLSEVTARRAGGAAGAEDESAACATQQQILLSNPILESFGNSKTLRNNNSSRFGKYMQVDISVKTGAILSAKIYSYLLEKSRVTRLTASERNYHIFYQMLTGLTAAEKSTYGLAGVQDYHYLSQSGCLTIEGVNDAVAWSVTLSAMQQLSFSEADISGVIAILAAILQLGNLQFTERRVNNMDATDCSNPDTLSQCARNLHLSTDDLSTALRFRSVTIRGETSMIPLNLADTIDSRDALAKALYDRLFSWIVSRLNSTLYGDDSRRSGGRSHSIGILDIFGFEIFPQNLFEQFCINYANEKLQQHFNSHIFTLEQQLYRDEAIDATSVDFCDNVGCVELIESKAGIIRMLEEETMLPQGSDRGLIEKLHSRFAHDKKAGKNRYYDIIKKQPNVFVIRHYAGEVSYDSQGMLAKSKDRLHDLLELRVGDSKLGVVQEMWDINERLQQEGMPTTTTAQAMTQTMRKRASSLGSQFSAQLNTLMQRLNACQPHFIRCIKPNLHKQASAFSSALVMTQLSYAGLFEAIKVRKSGFAYRKLYPDFLKEYRVLCQASQLQAMAKLPTPRQQAEYMLTALPSLAGALSRSEWQLGKTKLFMRNSQRLVLGQLKDAALTVKIIILQSAFRGCSARRRVRAMRDFQREATAALLPDGVRDRRDALRRLLELAQRRLYAMPVCRQLRVTLEYLADEEHTQSLLRQALQPPPALPLLQAAVDSLSALQAKLPSSMQPKQEMEQQRQELLRLMERVVAVEAKRRRLRERRLEEDWPAVRLVLSELDEMGEGQHEEAAAARAALAVWEEEEARFASLKAAVEGGDVEAIESCVEAVRRLPLDDARSAQLAQARDALLRGYSALLEAATAAADGEAAIRRRLMPKLEQLQFVDLVYRAQAWLDQQDSARVSQLKRRQSALAPAPPAADAAELAAAPAPPEEEEDDVTRAHRAEKQRRLEAMERINALQKRRSVIAAPPSAASDDEPPPPPPPAESELPPPPPPEFDTSLEEFFPPPPPAAYSDRDAALTAAMASKDYARLQQLLAECVACGHSGRLVRMADNVLKQWAEEEKVRDVIRRLREDGYDDEERMREAVRTAGLVGLSDDAEVRELRYVVYTMSACERVELRMQWARERDNVPLLLTLLSRANDEGLQSERIDAIRAELERSGVSRQQDLGGRLRPAKGREEGSLQERYRRFMETYSPALSASLRPQAHASPLSLPLSLSSYPFLRRDKNYAKHSILYKEKVMAGMLRHQREDIPTSLLFLSTAHCGSKRESQRVKQLAKHSFKNLRGFMCDAYHPYPVSLGFELLSTAAQEPSLRDELYCQLIKQTTDNRNQASLLLGLKLLYLALSAFLPSAPLSPFVLSHIAVFALHSLPDHPLGLASVEEMATQCWLVWEARERERESRERELQERRSRGEAVTEAEAAGCTAPSMAEVERLTMGLMPQDAADAPSQPSAGPSPRSGRPAAAPKSPLNRGQVQSTLSVALSPAAAGPPSPRSPGGGKVLLVPSPIAARRTAPVAGSAPAEAVEASFSYAPPSPSGGRPAAAAAAAADESGDLDSLVAKGFSREKAEAALKLKGSRAEALSFLMQPTFAPPPSSIARSLPLSHGGSPAGFSSASGAPIPPPPIFNKAKPSQLSGAAALSTLPAAPSPRSAPPARAGGLPPSSFSVSVPSSPATQPPSTPPPVPTLLSPSRKTPPSLPGAPAVPHSAAVAPAPPAAAQPLSPNGRSPAPPPLPPALSVPSSAAPSPRSAPPPLLPPPSPSAVPPAPPTPPPPPPPMSPSMAPPAPPPASAATPRAATSPRPAEEDGSGGGSDALLAAIRKGRQMRKVGPPAEKSLAERLGQ